MSNYVPHYTKKLQRLRREVLDLRRLISHGVSGEKLLVQAEKVRDAKVRVLQARLATVPPRGEFLEADFARLGAQIKAAKRATPHETLQKYGVAMPRGFSLVVYVEPPSWPIANPPKGR